MCGRRRRAALCVQFHGCRLRSATGRRCRRRHAQRPHQPLWHLEADERVDVARSLRRHAATPRRAAVLQRGRFRPGLPHWPKHTEGDPAHEGGGGACGGQAPARGRLRHRLPHARRYRRARLHSRRRLSRSPPEGTGVPAQGRRLPHPELRLWQGLQRARTAGCRRPCVGAATGDPPRTASRR